IRQAGDHPAQRHLSFGLCPQQPDLGKRGAGRYEGAEDRGGRVERIGEPKAPLRDPSTRQARRSAAVPAEPMNATDPESIPPEELLELDSAPAPEEAPEEVPEPQAAP